MNNEDSFRLMDSMYALGFKAEIIMFTLCHCSKGDDIGTAFIKAASELHALLGGSPCKTDTDKSAQDKTTCDSLEKTCSTMSNEQPTKPQEDKSE